MKQSLLIAIMLITASALAKPVYTIDGKQVSKLQAVEALLQHKRVERVSKCDVELTSKFAVKCIPRQGGVK